MVKLTFENMAVKLGKPINPSTMTSLVLTNAQIDDLGSLEKFVALTTVDLSSNRICFQRQLTGLFAAKATITHLNLAGNPVCSSSNYRLFVISSLPALQVLDDIEVTAAEQELAERVIVKGETLSVDNSRVGVEEEEAEIARLQEEASKTRIDPARRREDMLREQARLFEAERAEAERIASLLDQPIDEPAESVPNAADLEKQAKAAAKAKEKAEKEEKARLAAEQKAAAKAAQQADSVAKKKAKEEAEAAAKAEALLKKQQAQEAKNAVSKQSAAQVTPVPVTPQEPEKPAGASLKDNEKQREVIGSKFQDARSGLSISTALSDAETVVISESIAPIEVVPKRKVATEDDIFGPAKHETLDFNKLSGASVKPSLGFLDDDDDLFSKASRTIDSKQATKVTAAKATSATKKSLFDDDDDDLFGASKKPASSSKGTSDDLFAMLGEASTSKTTAPKKSGIDAKTFDIDSFISSTKSSGGLFDD